MKSHIVTNKIRYIETSGLLTKLDQLSFSFYSSWIKELTYKDFCEKFNTSFQDDIAKQAENVEKLDDFITIVGNVFPSCTSDAFTIFQTLIKEFKKALEDYLTCEYYTDTKFKAYKKLSTICGDLKKYLDVFEKAIKDYYVALKGNSEILPNPLDFFPKTINPSLSPVRQKNLASNRVSSSSEITNTTQQKSVPKNSQLNISSYFELLPREINREILYYIPLNEILNKELTDEIYKGALNDDIFCKNYLLKKSQEELESIPNPLVVFDKESKQIDFEKTKKLLSEFIKDFGNGPSDGNISYVDILSSYRRDGIFSPRNLLTFVMKKDVKLDDGLRNKLCYLTEPERNESVAVFKGDWEKDVYGVPHRFNREELITYAILGKKWQTLRNIFNYESQSNTVFYNRADHSNILHLLAYLDSSIPRDIYNRVCYELSSYISWENYSYNLKFPHRRRPPSENEKYEYFNTLNKEGKTPLQLAVSTSAASLEKFVSVWADEDDLYSLYFKKPENCANHNYVVEAIKKLNVDSSYLQVVSDLLQGFHKRGFQLPLTAQAFVDAIKHPKLAPILIYDLSHRRDQNMINQILKINPQFLSTIYDVGGQSKLTVVDQIAQSSSSVPAKTSLAWLSTHIDKIIFDTSKGDYTQQICNTLIKEMKGSKISKTVKANICKSLLDKIKRATTSEECHQIYNTINKIEKVLKFETGFFRLFGQHGHTKTWCKVVKALQEQVKNLQCMKADPKSVEILALKKQRFTLR